MKKILLAGVLVVVSFLSGYAFKAFLAPAPDPKLTGRVTGIGGIFFKCKDPGKLRDWYRQHLGIVTNAYGAVFEWYQGADSTKKGFTSWSPFRETTKYFEPSTRDFMINYRVQNLDGLVRELKASGVQVLDTVVSYDYGKFVHILDGEGNKVELWEPDDIAYGKLGAQLGATTTK